MSARVIKKLGEYWDKVFVGEFAGTVLPALAAGERALAQMDAGGRLLIAGKVTKTVTVAPAVTAGAYDANDVIGGKLTFADALRLPSKSGKLQSIHIVSKSGAALGQVKLGLFKADPAASTFTNNSAPSLHANDFDKLIGIFTLGAVSAAMGTPTIGQLDNINKAFDAAGTSLYGVLITPGTPSPGSTADLSVTIAIEQD